MGGKRTCAQRLCTGDRKKVALAAVFFRRRAGWVGVIRAVPDANQYRERSKRCRFLARWLGDSRAAKTLVGMANEYEAKAREAEDRQSG